jgi:hypothetical protein
MCVARNRIRNSVACVHLDTHRLANAELCFVRIYSVPRQRSGSFRFLFCVDLDTIQRFDFGCMSILSMCVYVTNFYFICVELDQHSQYQYAWMSRVLSRQRLAACYTCFRDFFPVVLSLRASPFAAPLFFVSYVLVCGYILIALAVASVTYVINGRLHEMKIKNEINDEELFNELPDI